MSGSRVVYGATCRWWDSIDKVGSKDGTRTGLPVCPHCGGVLFEVPSEDDWWRGVDRFEADGHPGYRAFIEWLRGKCFPTSQAAWAAYESEHA